MERERRPKGLRSMPSALEMANPLNSPNCFSTVDWIFADIASRPHNSEVRNGKEAAKADTSSDGGKTWETNWE